MSKKPSYERLTLEKFIVGGQTLGQLADGRKAMVWGGLPGEDVTVALHRRKSNYVEGVVSEVHSASPQRIEPADPGSYLSTSPWQIASFELEQRTKSELVVEAFRQAHIALDSVPEIYSDGQQFGYRNKVEFSWYGGQTESGDETLDLAFHRRGSRGKIIVEGSALLPTAITDLALAIRDLLRTKPVSAYNLKTLLIRADQQGGAVWQLYIKDKLPDLIDAGEATQLPALGGEIIYSNPKSPASVISERLAKYGTTTLTDKIDGTEFRYAAESFFQVNLPVYERALSDIQQFIDPALPLVDLYSGVGTIGLSMPVNDLTLVESNPSAVAEMERNIVARGLTNQAKAVLAPSEDATDYIVPDANIIVDPPRAGLHTRVIERLLETAPRRIIYLSCNPTTQARDTKLLDNKYQISDCRGYNFFPRTPHIESLVVLDQLTSARR